MPDNITALNTYRRLGFNNTNQNTQLVYKHSESMGKYSLHKLRGLRISHIDKAISIVSNTHSFLGAIQNRLEHTVNNLGNTAENLTAAEYFIREIVWLAK